MRLKIRHSTQYVFDTPVSYGLQQIRKTPKSSRQQDVLIWTTEVEGGRIELSFEDHHNNTVDLLSFEKNATKLVVISSGEIEITETQGIVGRHIGLAPLWLYRQVTPRTKPGPAVRALVRSSEGETEIERLHALMRTVSEEVRYEVGASRPDWSAEDALSAGRGVCQDHAHVFIACARDLGLPARYVSGYLMLDDRVQQDAMHAWAEVHLDGLGWVGFDPSNGISPDARYVRVATGLDYGEAAPVIGTQIGGVGEVLDVSIEVAQQ